MVITLNTNGITYNTDSIHDRIKNYNYLKTTTNAPEILAYYDWRLAEEEATLAAIRAQLAEMKYRKAATNDIRMTVETI